MKKNIWKKLFVTLAFCLCFALAGAGTFLLTACSNDGGMKANATTYSDEEVVFDGNNGSIEITKDSLVAWHGLRRGITLTSAGFVVSETSGSPSYYTISFNPGRVPAGQSKIYQRYLYTKVVVDRYTDYTVTTSARAETRTGLFGVTTTLPPTAGTSLVPTLASQTIAVASSASTYTLSFNSGSDSEIYLFFGTAQAVSSGSSTTSTMYVYDLSFTNDENGNGVQKMSLYYQLTSVNGLSSGVYGYMPTEVTRDGYYFLGWSSPPVDYVDELMGGSNYGSTNVGYSLEYSDDDNGAYLTQTFYRSSGQLVQISVSSSVSLKIHMLAFNNSNICVGKQVSTISATSDINKTKQANYFVPSGTRYVKISCCASNSSYNDLDGLIRKFLVDLRESYEEGTIYDPGDNLLVYEDHTLVASYGKSTFRVIYDTQGVSVNESLPTTHTLAYHSKITWSLPVLTSADFEFRGWAGFADGSGYYVSSGSSSNTQLDKTNAEFNFVQGTVTLYAIGVKKVAVMFDPNDGTNYTNLAYNAAANVSGNLSISYNSSTEEYTVNGSSGGYVDVAKLVDAGNYAGAQTLTIVFKKISGSASYSGDAPYGNQNNSWGLFFENGGFRTSYGATGNTHEFSSFAATLVNLTADFKLYIKTTYSFSYSGQGGAHGGTATRYCTISNLKFKLAIYKGSATTSSPINPMARMYNSDDRYGDLPTISGLTRTGYTASGWAYHSAPLPSAYQAVRYLESTGTQWIDTGVDVAATTKIQAEIIFNEAFYHNMMYGAWTNFSLALRATNEWTVGGGGTYIQNIGLSGVAKKFYQVEHDRGTLSLNGATASISSNNNTPTSGRHILLFAASDSSSGNNPFSWGGFGQGRIYDFRIYEGSTIVRSFVPCYRKSDGKPGMYDFVTQTFFTNQGSGEFSYGSASAGIESNSSLKVAANHTIYTQWVANTYTVTFKPNEGSVNPTTKTVTYNDLYGTLPTPTRSAYDFTGWHLGSASGSSITDSSRVTTASNHELWATWSAKSVSWTIKLHTYSLNGTTITDGPPSGGQIKINYTKVSGGVASADEQTQTAASATYTAHYGTDLSYTITVPTGYVYIGSNGGSVTKPTMSSSPSLTGSLSWSLIDKTINFYFQAVAMEVKYDSTNKYYYYEDGEFPQAYVGDPTNHTLNSASLTNEAYSLALGGYTIHVFAYSGKKYAKVTSTTACSILLNGGSTQNFSSATYWFEVQPIRWRISDYGVDNSWWYIGDTQTDVVGVSDILGYGYVKADREANYGDKAKDILTWQFQFNSNWFTKSFNSSYGASSYNIDTQQYNAQGSPTPVSSTSVSVSVDQKDSTYDRFYLASTAEIGMHTPRSGISEKGSFRVNASDLSAFLMQRDYNACYGWTRTLHNLGSACAVGPNGSIVPQWFDTQIGYVFAHRVTRGTRVS